MQMLASLNVEHTSVSDVGCKRSRWEDEVMVHVQLEGLWKFLCNCQSWEESLVSALCLESPQNIRYEALGSPFNYFFNLPVGISYYPFSSIHRCHGYIAISYKM